MLRSSMQDDVDDCCIKGFQISLSWDYPDDWCLKDVQDAVFHVYNQNDKIRSESQYVTDCVQASGGGVVLMKPNIKTDVVACELHFTANPTNCQFCIVKLIVVSEARHLELYLDDLYEKTTRGCMLTMKKGKQSALYECQFDLSSHVQGTHKISLKFLSLPDKSCMRLQTVVVKVIDCPPKTEGLLQNPLQNGVQGSMDIENVKNMIAAMGVPVAGAAQRLINDIEHQQKQRQLTQFQGLAQLGLMAGSLLPVQQQPQQQPPAISPAQNLLSNMLQLSGALPQSQLMLPQQTLHGNEPVRLPAARNLLSSMLQLPNTLLQPPPTHIQQGLQSNVNIPNNLATTENLLSSMLQSQSVVHQPQQMQVPQSYNDKEHLPRSLFPVSRETTKPKRTVKLRRHKSLNSVDRYNGYGTANPPGESVLANAVMNVEQSRKVAESRASMIEHENYEQAQMEFVKTFLKSQDTSKFSVVKSLDGNPEKPPRHLKKSEKKRPYSLAALPTSSELDFVKLLGGLMKEEDQSVDTSEDDQSTTSNQSTRWEAYLRSRVRASKRQASPNLNSENHDAFSADSVDTFTTATMSQGWPSASKSPNEDTMNDVMLHIKETERRIVEHFDTRLKDLKTHLDMRIDSLYDTIVSLRPQNFVEANDFSDIHDTEV